MISIPLPSRALAGARLQFRLTGLDTWNDIVTMGNVHDLLALMPHRSVEIRVRPEDESAVRSALKNILSDWKA